MIRDRSKDSRKEIHGGFSCPDVQLYLEFFATTRGMQLQPFTLEMRADAAFKRAVLVQSSAMQKDFICLVKQSLVEFIVRGGPAVPMKLKLFHFNRKRISMMLQGSTGWFDTISRCKQFVHYDLKWKKFKPPLFTQIVRGNQSETDSFSFLQPITDRPWETRQRLVEAFLMAWHMTHTRKNNGWPHVCILAFTLPGFIQCKIRIALNNTTKHLCSKINKVVQCFVPPSPLLCNMSQQEDEQRRWRNNTLHFSMLYVTLYKDYD